MSYSTFMNIFNFSLTHFKEKFQPHMNQSILKLQKFYLNMNK